MSRALQTNMESATLAPHKRPVVFVKLAFDSGDVRVWSGYGTIEFNFEVYSGLGQFGGISVIEETSELRAPPMQLQLSGIPSSLVALALGETYKNRLATVWFGALDETDAIITEPFQIFAGPMDVMTIQDSGDTATITVNVENELIELEEPKLERFTDGDQKRLFPGDRGLEYVAGLIGKEIIWGPDPT